MAVDTSRQNCAACNRDSKNTGSTTQHWLEYNKCSAPIGAEHLSWVELSGLCSHLSSPMKRVLEATRDDGSEIGSVPVRATSPAVVRVPQRRLTTDDTARIISGYAGGISMKALAEELQLTRQTIARVLKREGITLRQIGLSDSQIDDAIQLYRSGMSLAKIGEKLAVDHGTVRRQLLRRGVAMRNSHGRGR